MLGATAHLFGFVDMQLTQTCMMQTLELQCICDERMYKLVIAGKASKATCTVQSEHMHRSTAYTKNMLPVDMHTSSLP